MELHYFPSSYWSRVINLVLTEKGIDAERRFVDIRTNASFDPEYLKLNPRGVVPTLVDGDRVIWDSLEIARYLDEACPDPALYTRTGDDSLIALVERLEAVPVMLFSYSIWVKGLKGERSADILADKVRRGFDYAERHPELREAYERKARFFEAFRERVYDAEHVAAERDRTHRLLDEIGAGISAEDHAHGSSYSLADAILTAMLYRFVDLGLLDHWHGDDAHPLHAYYERLTTRPSFDAVFVSDPLIP